MLQRLTIGDTVKWRGGFGTQAASEVEVTGLELTAEPRSKYGEPVVAVSWADVRADRVVIDLANGHWCYASQIEQIR